MTNARCPFLRLIYASRATSAWAEDMDGVLSDILAEAVPRNRAREVTGLIITHAGWVVQGLEGPPDAVRATYAAILADYRHRDIVVRMDEPVSERLFPRWSLCARALSSADAVVVRDLAPGGQFDPADAAPHTLVRLLSIISKAHDHRFDAQQRMIVRR
jgi:Sensors of blue-light using FAD